MRRTVFAYCTALSIAGFAPEARADDPVTIHSPSELTAGVITATLGGVSVSAGLVMLVASGVFASSCAFCSSDAKLYGEIGIPLVIAGAIATIGGIWMALEGGRPTRPRWSLSPFGFAATF